MLMTDLLMVTSGSNHVMIIINIEFLNETKIGFGRQMSLTS